MLNDTEHPTTLRYGWIPDPPDDRDHMFVPAADADDYPDSVDMRSGCPDVYNQGHIGSCTANAIAGAFEFELMKQGLEDFMPSRLFIYYNERRMQGKEDYDSGGHLRDGMKSIHVEGVCSEDGWPYDGTRANDDKSWPDDAPAGQKPPEDCYGSALQNKAVKYQRVKQDINHMKDCLVQGYPFAGGFNTFPSLHDSDVKETDMVPMPGPDEERHGGHAILVVGYDDNQGEDGEGAWLIRNSWGTEWGDEGYGWLPYDYLTDTNLSHDFWTLRLVTTDGAEGENIRVFPSQPEKVPQTPGAGNQEKILIAVMGVTGAGKSTFIRTVTGRTEVIVGDGLQSCTHQVTEYDTIINGRTFTLVDVPGFNDTNIPDSEILDGIAKWLSDSYGAGRKLSGILYLHKISENRMYGTAVDNLKMFRTLCGENFYKNIVLTTTHWTGPAPTKREKDREAELVDTKEFWGIMLGRGAEMRRFTGDKKSALSILDLVVGFPPSSARIQVEIVDEGKKLNETSAGKLMNARIEELKAKFKKDLESAKQSILAEKDAEFKKMFEAEKRETEKKMREADEKLENLRKQLWERPAPTPTAPAPTPVPAIATTIQYRTRSAPGRNRIKEYASLTLSGSSFYFVGPAKDYRVQSSGLASHTDDKHNQTRYVALGTKQSWYVHYHIKGECYTQWSKSLNEHYPKLTNWMREHKAYVCPVSLALGPSGNFYIRMENGAWKYHLPHDTIDAVSNWSKVRRVWLGHDNAYVIHTQDHKWKWNLKKHYSGLGQRIKCYDGIKDLAINLYNGESWVLLGTDGSCSWSVGSGNSFKLFSFQEYMSVNFGSKW